MMKPIYCIFCIATFLLIGCSKTYEVSCITQPTTYFMVNTGDTSKIEYSGVTVGAYTPGTNFLIVDSLFSYGNDTLVFRDSYVRLNTFYPNKGFDKHDWIITFRPSGRQFKIRNITRQQGSAKMSDNLIEDKTQCINSHSYVLNDVLVSVAQQNVNQNLATEEYIYIKY